MEKKKTKKKAVKKVKGRSDEDLFGNTDDIFGDTPDQSTAAKPKKKKKKANAADGDVDTPVAGVDDLHKAGTQDVENVEKEATGNGQACIMYTVLCIGSGDIHVHALLH